MFLSRPNEKLHEHVERLLRQYNNLNSYKNIDSIIDNIINKLCKENKEITDQKETIKKLFIEHLTLHDEGKKNPYFQAYVGNEEFDSYKFNKINKHHAELSAIYYSITMYEKYIKSINCKRKRAIQEMLKDIVLAFAFNIYRHHLDLQDCDKDLFIKDLIEYYDNNKEQFMQIEITNIEHLMKFKNRIKVKYENEYTYFIFFKLSFSILVCCDFMAVYSCYNKEDLKINVIDMELKEAISNKFNNNEVIKKIKAYEVNEELEMHTLNKYRTQMYLEAEQNILNYKEKSNLYYLEAPTGCGKSLTGLNLAYLSLEDIINKIYFVGPFNNIIEQTNKVIRDSFYENAIVVNSRESIFISDEEEAINYDKDFLNSQLINYPVILISHVRFFDAIFSANRFKNLMLCNMCNSIFIIDEIQAYKNKLWIHIINSLKEFGEMLNIKVIIMSATLPKMSELMDNNSYEIPDLINKREYYYNYFKRRVTYDFSLLKEGKNKSEEVFNKIDKVIKTTNKHRILIECLKTDRVEEFYEEMKKYKKNGFLIFKMLGITNNINRNHIINIIQEKINKEYKNKKVILVGTQCIEAGIDIDMQVGFKDISIMDADEQFAGRVERNFNDTGIIYFFDIDDGDFIYKGDYRTERNLKNKEWREVFENKSFFEFYKRNYKWLLEKEHDNYKKFKEKLVSLNYKEIEKIMKLIESETYNFLFLCKYKNKKSATEIYNQYKEIQNSDLGYTEKQVKLKAVKKELSNYVYSINSFRFKSNILVEKVDNMYIIENGERFFDNTEEGELTQDSSLDTKSFIQEIELKL